MYKFLGISMAEMLSRDGLHIGESMGWRVAHVDR